MKLLTLSAIVLYGFNNLATPTTNNDHAPSNAVDVVGEISMEDFISSDIWTLNNGSFFRYQLKSYTDSDITETLFTTYLNYNLSFSVGFYHYGLAIALDKNDNSYHYYGGLDNISLSTTPVKNNDLNYFELWRNPIITLTFTDDTTLTLPTSYVISDFFYDTLANFNDSRDYRSLLYNRIGYNKYGGCPLKSLKLNDIYPYFNFGNGYADKSIIYPNMYTSFPLNVAMYTTFFYNNSLFSNLRVVNLQLEYDSNNVFLGLFDSALHNYPFYYSTSTYLSVNSSFNVLYSGNINDNIYTTTSNNLNGDTLYYIDNPLLSYVYGQSSNYPLTLSQMLNGLFNNSNNLIYQGSNDFNNLFNLFSMAFKSWASIFSLSIGGISLSIFIFAPLLVAFLVFLIHLVKRG